MHTRTLVQPTTGQSGIEFERALGRLSGPAARAFLVSAWTKQSGIGPLRRALSEFRDQGGTVSSATGIDLRGTSREGVESLLGVSDNCRIVHDLGRSFHPKHYLAVGRDQAVALIGSGNLTGGGLYTNYEMFAVVDMDLTREGDREFLTSLEANIKDLIEHPSTSHQVTSDLIDELSSAGYLPPEAGAPKYDERGQLGVEGMRWFGRRPDLPWLPRHGQGAKQSSPGIELQAHPLRRGLVTYTKELTPNDVGTTGGHQAGIAVSKLDIAFFPTLAEVEKNPRVAISVVDERGGEWLWNFIHYNNKIVASGTRDEYRVTGMTTYLRDRDARPGDIVVFSRLGEGNYEINFLGG